ncbi:MAG: hypothetical protein Q8P23_02865, partial [bacterium]|nr:hypothetical protein [bacterium]
TDTKSGLSGTIKTPGSVIVATLNKVLGGQQDIITRMGNVGPEINGILKNISTVMQTVNFATQILGGADTNGSFAQSGLLGIGQTSASNPTSRLSQFQNSPGNLGVTPSTVYKNAATLPVSGSDTLNRVVQYESSWNTIRGAANSASTTVVSLAKFCTAAADKAALTMTVNEFGTQITPSTDLSTIHSVFIDAARAQADTVRSAITTQIAPVIVRANTAFASISTTRAFIQRLQNGLNSGVSTTSSGYLADLQTLQSMPPSDSDLGDALIEVESFNTATAIPAGSLTVAGGSIIDRMSLISTNAEALKTTVCNPASSLYVTEVVSGG